MFCAECIWWIHMYCNFGFIIKEFIVVGKKYLVIRSLYFFISQNVCSFANYFIKIFIVCYIDSNLYAAKNNYTSAPRHEFTVTVECCKKLSWKGRQEKGFLSRSSKYSYSNTCFENPIEKYRNPLSVLRNLREVSKKKHEWFNEYIWNQINNELFLQWKLMFCWRWKHF